MYGLPRLCLLLWPRSPLAKESLLMPSTDVATRSDGAVQAVQTLKPILDPNAFALDVWSSFPEARANDVIRYMQGRATPLSEMIGKTILVEHLLAHRVEMTDEETGEITLGDRIVLVTPKGDAYQAVSAGVRRSVQLIAHYKGLPPWTPPLKLEVAQIPTRRGFRTFTLTPVD